MSRANVRLVEELPKVGRTSRRPKHTFNLKTRPWQIQPFFIAPVMPGETMKNLMLSARTVSKPIKNKLIGWHLEYYFFYVKHRDLPSSTDLQAMHVAGTALPAGMRQSGQSLPYYGYTGGVKYVEQCLQRVVEDYFRSEDDGAWNSKLIGGLPAAHINTITALESIRIASAGTPANDHEMPGEVSEMPFGVAASWSDEYAQWEQMRALKLTTASFEDYLRQHGQTIPEQTEDESRPELVRYVREFTYPTNTVEPTTGVPSSAVVWSTAERADKDRYFKEPGFLFGVQVARPKVYFAKQLGAVVGWLDDAFSWLPAATLDQGWTTLKQYTATEGPAAGASGTGYWLDLRDLWVFGDQYVNYALTTSDSVVQLPSSGFNTRYAADADADALFVGATAADRILETDGMVQLSMLGKIVNTT